MQQTELRQKINFIKNATMPNSLNPFLVGEVLEALNGTSSEPVTDLQDVVEAASFGDFPTAGSANTIYIDLSDDAMYRWDGTIYKPLNASDSTITIRSLNDLNSYQSPGVYACLSIQRVGVRPTRTVVTSYTLRIESSSAMIMQFLENREGYRWRTYRNEAWGDWEVVVFATTTYVDEALSEILEAQMPTSPQEVVELPTYDSRPAVGEANTIYIDLSTDDMYYWNGSDYAPLNASSTAITISSLSDLNDQTTAGVYTVLWNQIISGRRNLVSYTLRVENSTGIISQYLENKNGYSWRKGQTKTGVWDDWQNVIFATTTYVDEAIGDIETILDTLING